MEYYHFWFKRRWVNILISNRLIFIPLLTNSEQGSEPIIELSLTTLSAAIDQTLLSLDKTNNYG